MSKQSTAEVLEFPIRKVAIPKLNLSRVLPSVFVVLANERMIGNEEFIQKRDICGVFTTVEKAKAWRDSQDPAYLVEYEIEEWILDFANSTS